MIKRCERNYFCIMTAVILGMGCNKCSLLEYLIIDISNEIDLNVAIEYNEDVESFIFYKIETTPALLVNNQILTFKNDIDRLKIKNFLLENLNNISNEFN
jgi:hypothetical protein